MLTQLLLGSAVTLLSVIAGAFLWWMMNEALEAMEGWIRRPPHALKSFSVMILVVLVTVLMMAIGVCLWAALLVHMELFMTLEEATYFSIVAYTTLGLSDEIAMPREWRLLGGIVGANGFLMFGLMTAILTDSLRHVRRVQHDLRD